MKDKYIELLREAKNLAENREYLSDELQRELLTKIIEFAFTIDGDDINFTGENDYGHNMKISVARGYGFTISLCWEKDSIWCFQDHGYVHPNLATVSGVNGKKLIERVGELAYSWAMGISK